MKKIDVYDFDGTIYNGDSTIDFFLYALKKKKILIKYVPIILIFFVLKFMKIISTKKFKEKYFSFLRDIKDIDKLVIGFWKNKENKINNYFLENVIQKENIYVISASPEFLLRPYISKFKNIKLIATRMDNKGNILGENCKGKEKISRLKKEEQEFEIENFYTDSIADLPLVEISKKAYYVKDGKVEKWNTKKMKAKENNKKTKFIFLLFLVVYIVLGVQLSYNHYKFNEQYDIMFDADPVRVIGEISNIFGDHFRISVHPLVVIIIQPIYFILSGITQDKILTLIIISSIVSALSVAIMYKIFKMFSKNEITTVLLTLCYGFIFSNFIFTATIELYNIATLVLISLWYFVIKKVKEGWRKSDFAILVILGILALGITITNFVIFLIACLVLLISKKVNFKKLFLANIVVVILFLGLNYFQSYIWQNTPRIAEFGTTSAKEGDYIKFEYDNEKVKNILRDCLYNPIVGTNVELMTKFNGVKTVKFQQIELWNKVIVSVFLLFIIAFTIKNFKRNKEINLGILLAILFNFLLHIVYGNSECFLYSLHFMHLIFMLFGINCLSEKGKPIKISNIILLTTLLISEILINSKVFAQILRIVRELVQPSNYYINNFNFKTLVIVTGIIAISLIIILKIILHFMKKAKQSNKEFQKYKFIAFAFVFIILFESVFVMLQTIPKYEQILWKPIGSRDTKNIVVNTNYKQFENEYKNEINSYLEYVEEYKEFINKYRSLLYYEIPDVEFYLFGMGNRRKILYKEGKLIDLDTQEIIKQFDLDTSLVIPNEYTVLIKEKNGQLDKIYEDNNGIYLESNNDRNAIEGTEINIDLYNFESQKYKNIKKVLYSEVLFNIKESKIYPNILTYKEPKYRDAAVACMVLKQTNNTEIISDWVSSIDNIYDNQAEEPENLGQLLYIISTQKDKNEQLIEKIENEAKRISREDSKGYYLTGGNAQNKYQSMWYDLGMEALGKESKFYYTEQISDYYSNFVWWRKNREAKNLVETSKSPYLCWANCHAFTAERKTFVNNKLYPLSWEKESEQANYTKTEIIDKSFVDNKVSPTHVWTASEMLLFIMDKTNDLSSLTK